MTKRSFKLLLPPHQFTYLRCGFGWLPLVLKVTFTSSNGNFTKVTTTDAYGSFQLEFSGDEFNATDSNANGLLDAQEGFITVRGGIDRTTNESFGTRGYRCQLFSCNTLTTILNALFKKVFPKPKLNQHSLLFGFQTSDL